MAASFDANFGLVRKKNFGTSIELPKHNDFFIVKNEMDSFVSKCSESSKDEVYNNSNNNK